MKKLLIILFLLPIICLAQVKTQTNIGIDPATGEPGFLNHDTTRTIYYQGPGLYTVGDTVYSGSGAGVWSLNGTNAYYNNGRVGIGVAAPRTRFHLESGYSTTVPIDSMGLMLSDTAKWYLGINTYPIPPPFIIEANSQSSSIARKTRFRIYAQGVNGSAPNVYFQSAPDTSTYSTWLRVDGIFPNFLTGITSASGNFTGALTVAGITNLGGYNLLNKTSGNVSLGKNTYTYTIDPSAILALYSNNIQGLLLPKLTTAQRDSIGYTVSSVTVTNGGSGYTLTPSVDYGTLNPSAPVTSGTLTTGGSTPTGTTVTLSGGVITAITITNGGYYNGAVKVTISGGGGTGATATATMARLLPDGLLIYNTDIHAIQTWNGTSWVTNGYQSGTSTLASGTVTVTVPSILSTSRVMLTYNTPSGTQGFLSAPVGSITAGTSFVINSSSGSDNSTVNWQIIN